MRSTRVDDERNERLAARLDVIADAFSRTITSERWDDDDRGELIARSTIRSWIWQGGSAVHLPVMRTRTRGDAAPVQTDAGMWWLRPRRGSGRGLRWRAAAGTDTVSHAARIHALANLTVTSNRQTRAWLHTYGGVRTVRIRRDDHGEPAHRPPPRAVTH
jgi:hypothetical protein